MAKKINLDFNNEATCVANKMPRGITQGYEVGALAIFQSPVSKLWRCLHINTMSPTMHEFDGWKTKKQALIFAEELQNHGLNFMVESANEFQAKNDIDLMAYAFKLAMEKATNGQAV